MKRSAGSAVGGGPARWRRARRSAVAVLLVIGVIGPVGAPPSAATGCVPATPATCLLHEAGTLAGIRVGATVEPAETTDTTYASTLTTHFGSVTPENALKWYSVQNTRGTFTFGPGDTVVNFAVANGMEIRGHALVWSKDEYTPDWVEAISDPNELRTVMEEHITAVIDRYEDRIHRWDVVNEPLATLGTGPSDSVFWSMGSGWIADAFAAAHAADPTAELWLNEFGSDWVPGKHAALLALVADLVADGVPIDGVGIQTHRLPNSTLDAGVFAQQLRDFANLGLDVAVTELDVPTSPTDAAAFTKQAVEYGKVFDACLAVTRCTEVTVWGVTDAATWLDTLGPPFTAPTRPLLFDSAYAAKPAYTTSRDRLAAVAVSGRTVPSAPTVTGVTAGVGRVTVAFTPAPAGAFADRSFTASCASTNGGAPGTLTGSASPLVVTGLTSGKAYRCRVAATNLVGTGTQSALSASVTVPTVPSAAAGAVATPGASAATLSWTAPLSTGGLPITGYVVVPTRNGVVQAARTFSSTATTQVVTGLTNLASYTFTVAAVNAVGTGPASSASAAITVGVPIAPTAVRAVAAPGTATVSWTAPTANGGSAITAYVVTPVRNGTVLPAAIVSAPATMRVFNGLTNGAAYSFRVAARNAVGTGPVNSAMTPVIVGPVTVPGAPGAPVGTPGDGRVTLAWTAPASSGSASITAYTVAPFMGSAALPHKTFLAGAIPIMTGLPNGTAFSFKVRAVSAAGTGPWSAMGPTVVVGTPTAPRSAAAVAGTKSATVSWLPPLSTNGATVTGYLVTPYIGGVARPVRTFDAAATSRLITGLATGVSYTFTVQAVNSRGAGPRSTPTGAVLVG